MPCAVQLRPENNPFLDRFQRALTVALSACPDVNAKPPLTSFCSFPSSHNVNIQHLGIDILDCLRHSLGQSLVSTFTSVHSLHQASCRSHSFWTLEEPPNVSFLLFRPLLAVSAGTVCWTFVYWTNLCSNVNSKMKTLPNSTALVSAMLTVLYMAALSGAWPHKFGAHHHGGANRRLLSSSTARSGSSLVFATNGSHGMNPILLSWLLELMLQQCPIPAHFLLVLIRFHIPLRP